MNARNTTTDCMAPRATSNLLKCDYLRSHAFTCEQAELAHINEQIRSLDNHISQLRALRDALDHRSRRLHNILSPIHSLPIEVLSHIFQKTINRDHNYAKYEGYRVCLRQAFVLSSVSAQFRHVTLCIPELWKRVPLKMTSGEAIGPLSSLLQHCMTLAPSVDVSINDALGEEEARSAVKVLLTSDVTQKINAVELISRRAFKIWIAKLKDSSFPILNNLDITCNERSRSLDLRTLNTLTQLSIYQPNPAHPILVPPSVRYLLIDDVRQKVLIPILYQCPNLEQCVAGGGHFFEDHLDVGAQFNKPLTLTHLKRLTLYFIKITTAPSWAPNIQLPSLEYLQFRHYNPGEFIGLLQLCHGVSTTLVTLKIKLVVDAASIPDDDLYQLCRLPFPNLRKLGFTFDKSEPILSVIRALTRRAEECNNAKPHHLPSLTSLTLQCNAIDEPRCLFGLLEKWRRIGETSFFHLKVKGFEPGLGDLSPEGEEELRSIVGNRQIEVTWDGRKVQQLLKRTDSSIGA